MIGPQVRGVNAAEWEAGGSLPAMLGVPGGETPPRNPVVRPMVFLRLPNPEATRLTDGKEGGKVWQRKDDPPRGYLGAPNHQEDVVNVRLPFRIATVAGLWLSSLGFAQGPATLPVRQVRAQAPETLAPPSGLSAAPVAAVGAIDPVPLNGPAGGGLALNSPTMPPYAWPTYAPYNNYSRVAYPNEYPYAAFPYIGPMYPFPKVPLGFRAIKLEWEDGHWWYGRTATKRDYWSVRYW